MQKRITPAGRRRQNDTETAYTATAAQLASDRPDYRLPTTDRAAVKAKSTRTRYS